MWEQHEQLTATNNIISKNSNKLNNNKINNFYNCLII